MSVYVDGERNNFGRMIMCHMLADTPDELHMTAKIIGMRREWYQSPNKASFPHYDLSLTRRKLAIKNGAIEVIRRELVEHMKRIKQDILDNNGTWKSSGWLD